MSKIENFNAPSFDSSGLQSRSGSGDRAAVGHFFGKQVQVDEWESMLADAAEEMSMLYAEKAEDEHFSERTKEACRSSETLSARAITAYLDAARALEDPEQLLRLAKRMLSGMGDPAEHARQAFDDPTMQFMALQYALQQGEREGQGQSQGVAEDVLEALRESLRDLEMAHGPAIRANINTVGTAAEAGASREEIVQFQTTYRDVVLGEASLAAMLKTVLNRFGDMGFVAGLQRLMQALGQDLAATRPSSDPIRLQSLMQDLYHLEVTATVLDGCKELQARLEDRHGVCTLSPIGLMHSLVDLSAEKWVSAQRFIGLSEAAGAREPALEIHFLTGVKGLLRKMPVQVFVDSEQRQSVFDAVQDALDAAIDREEGGD